MPSGTSVPFNPRLAEAARAWPFEEARKVLARVQKKQAKGETVEEVIFEPKPKRLRSTKTNMRPHTRMRNARRGGRTGPRRSIRG